ncbi:MAG: hypothetical protein ACI89Z_001129 [Porticoccus sp.]|jgi:hypothetical protein
MLACLFALYAQPAAKNPNEIISSLYGVDGVTLEDNPFFFPTAHFTQENLGNLQGLSETLSDFSQPLSLA